MEKHYRALVEGNLHEDSGRIDQPIARSKKDRKKMAIDPEGRPSITDWTVLARGRNVTLLDVHILTGRTHQIRAHMAALGHPLLGDDVYGDRAFNRQMKMQGKLCLCAAQLTLDTGGALPQLDGRTFRVKCPF